ncbi:hypothetical protein JAAARDRAFT_96532, partial [Jaapia argillacea MUCL 33604]
MISTQYIPHLIYSLSLTSISFHLLWQRRAAADQRAQLTAQISILDSLAERLRSSEHISLDELRKLRRLARPKEELVAGPLSGGGEIGWKDVIFGKTTAQDNKSSEEWERRDWDA